MTGRLLDRMFADKMLTSGIVGWLGANGDGKSAGLVGCRMHTLARGIPDLGTVRIVDWQNPRPCEDSSCTFPGHPDHGAAHPLWTPLVSYDQMLAWDRGTISLDEVQGIGDVHDSGGMPYQWRNAVRKLRHSDVSLMWTAPDWGSAPVPVRRVTRVVVQATGKRGVPVYLPCETCQQVHPKPTAGCSDRSRRRLWDANRRLRYAAYDARAFDEWTEAKRKPENRLARAALWMPKAAVGRAYDSHGPVLSIAAADHAGTCIGCGGTRRRQECSCEDYVMYKARHRRGAARSLEVAGEGQEAPAVAEAEAGRRRAPRSRSAGVPAPAKRAGVRAETRPRRRTAAAAATEAQD